MVTNVIVDIVLVLIAVIGFVIGIKNGFIKTVARPVKFVLALIMAFAWCEAAGAALIEPWLSAPLTGKLTAYITELCDGLAAEAAAGEMPTVIKLAASMCDIDIAEIATGTGAVLAESIVSAITAPFVGIISSIIAFVAIYIVAKLVLGLIVLIIDKIASDGGFVDVVNKLLGAVVMLAFSMIVAWGLVAVSDVILHLPVLAEQAWVQEFTGGIVFNFLKSVSPLEILLSF